MFKKIETYFLSSYELVDSRNYYRNLSIVMGLALTVFVFLFDPYDNYLYPLKYSVPIILIQIGYGLNLTFVIYVLNRILIVKIGFNKVKRLWKTYHHWLSFIIIYIISGFSGIIYHRFFIDVREVDFMYYICVTTPRTILIGGILFAILILHEKLHEKNKWILSQQNFSSSNSTATETDFQKATISLKSPTIKQSIEINSLDITYIKAFGNYVEIHSKNEVKSKLLRSPLHHVAKQLSSQSHIRKCHRQFYVNILEVECSKRNSERVILKIKGSLNSIPVSKKYIKEMLSLLDKNILS